MKRRLFTFALAALTIGLLGSCSKINERIDGLDKRVYDLENTKIASIEQQIAAINQSIADLETIRTNIQNLKNEQEAQGQDITDLQAKDQALEGKINDLRTYVDTELSKYATTEWANATFATLTKQAEIITDVEKLKTDLAGLDTKLDQDIANLKTYIEGWVNTQLSAYYKKAEIDVKVGELQAQITTLKEDSETNKTKIAELELNLNKLNQDLEEAKTTIKAAYEKAIKDAIEDYNGTITETIQSKIDEVNATIAALTGRVDDLETAVGLLTGRIDAIEAMIQSVSITPAYSDGSVEAVNGILTLKCTVSPAEALVGMESLKDSLLIYADSVKVKTKATTPAYMTIEVSEASVLDAAQGAITLKADISEYLPKGEDKALTVAVNIKNGISDYTTEFVPVTATNKIPTFKAVYDTNGGANTLTFYYDANDHSGEGTVYEDGTDKSLFDDTKNNGAKWGYNDKRGEIKSVVIDASVAGYKGLTSTTFMFQGMATATNISGAEHLDVSNVTDMSFMFNNFGGGNTNSHTTLNSVPNVSGWNTGNVTNMTAMFESYGNFSDNLAIVPDVSNWNTGNVTDMTFMFQKYGHESQNFNAVPDVSKWNTGNVTNMQQMFMEYGHKSTALNTVPNVSGWNTGKVTNMKQMFYNYGSTSENISCVLDLSGWDLSKITGKNGENVFNFNPKTFDVTIPAKTGEKSNEGGKWYYGDGTNHIAPPTGKTFTPTITGALMGEFSVSATKKVRFSKGNLWADASVATPVFYFETNQYDFQSSWSTSHVSHFFWSQSVNSAIAEEYDWSGSDSDVFFINATDTTAKAGFTVNVNGKDQTGWRALSTNEWKYLFNTRTMKNGGDRYTLNITYGGKMGVVLYPDDYSGSILTSGTDYTDANFPANCVFLPAASRRDVSDVSLVGGFGFYCSSTANGSDNACSVNFNSDYVNPDYDCSRYFGTSVRLVTEVPAAGDPGNGTEQYDPQVW